jgi:uncharacterized membrane protein
MATLEERLAAIEARLRALTERVWLLEQAAGGEAPEATAPSPPPAPAPPAVALFKPPPRPDPSPPVPAPAPTRLDLEHRIGARWATWVGVVAILFGAAFFLRWAFERNLMGPEVRTVLGLVAGAGLLLAGLGLHRRPDLPYLAEGLAGGGLGILYLTLYSAHAVYGFLGALPALAFMFAVTLVGALVAVATGRQVVAVLALVGGLLTPVLLATERPDERTLLAYLLVLDLLVLAIARFRSWPALARLAWAGTALLLLPAFYRFPAPPDPLARLVLLSLLFLLFLAVPLAREWGERRRLAPLDLLLVVANAGGYFWAVQATLERWRPALDAPYALGLAVLYTVLAARYRRRVALDEPTVLVHLAVAAVFVTLAIPLALDGPWVTLAWAAQGVAFLTAAQRLATPVAAWGGLAALALSVYRVLFFDAYRLPTPVWNPAFLVHLGVVAALLWAGALAVRVPADRWRGSGEAVRDALWAGAALLLAALLWREPSGLWPAGLLAAEVAALGGLCRLLGSRAFALAAPLVGALLLLRALAFDHSLAREAAADLVNAPLLVRIGAAAALAVAGGWIRRSSPAAEAAAIGGALSGAAGLALLVTLSLGWVLHEEVRLAEASRAGRRELAGEIRWRMQVGLSVLWTLYAAAALAWGFLRRVPAVRYAALGLFGLVIGKVFLADLAALGTAYRIVSFMVLGLVLLSVSYLYQRARHA